MGIIINGLDENPYYSEYGYQYGAYSYYGGIYGKYYEANNKESEGFTKDVSLSKAEIEKVIQEIECATNPRKMISLEEAKKMGMEAQQ